MKTLLARLGEILKTIQLQRAIVAGFVAILLFTTQMPNQIARTVDPGTQNQINRLESQSTNGRPRTTGQFQAEKESLEGRPGEVVKRMGSEFSDAADEAAETVGQTVKDLVPGLESKGLTKDS